MTAQPWWPDRVIGGYASYWVYQHLGNLNPEQLDADEVYAELLAIDDDDERTRYLDDVAWRADVDASSIRWSYYRDLGGAGRGVRLVAIDSRCSRQLDRTTAAWSTRRMGVGARPRRRSRAPLRPPGAGVDAAVADASGGPPPRGLGRSRVRGRLAAPWQVARRTSPTVARPRALGAFRGRSPRRWRCSWMWSGDRHRRRPCCCSAVTCTATTRRLPPQRCWPPEHERSTSSRCHRSATTSRESAGSPIGAQPSGSHPRRAPDGPLGRGRATSP